MPVIKKKNEVCMTGKIDRIAFKVFLLEHNIKQCDVAKSLDLNPATLCHYVNGSYRVPVNVEHAVMRYMRDYPEGARK